MDAYAPTTFAWAVVLPERLPLTDLGALHMPLPAREGAIGMLRMRHLIERFIDGAHLEGIRTASIADIHGNVEGLRRELTFCRQNGVTDLIPTGDYIDRDRHSIAVINELRAAQLTFKLHPLIGNHDLFFLRAMNGSRRDFVIWLGNGGLSVLREAEVGLDHWAKYIDERAQRSGMRPTQWVRDVLQYDRETVDRLHQEVEHNECLRGVAEWMQKNLFLSHLNEQGILHVHAGVPVHPDGTHALYYRSEGKMYSGLWALAKAEEDLFGALEAKLKAHPAYDFLEQPRSPVWIRDWESGPSMDLTQCNRLLDSLGVSGIVVGHTVQSKIENVHAGRLILGDRGLAVAYQNQPAVVLSAKNEGVRCVTSTRRSLSGQPDFEDRVERARRYARLVLDGGPDGYDDTPTMQF